MLNVDYMINDRMTNHFFTNDLHQSITNLNTALKGRGSIKVFTDAMVKGNGVPNGVSVKSLYEETILFPLILRDPGCGFLLFKIDGVDQVNENWAKKVGSALNTFVNEELLTGKTKEKIINNLVLEDILFEGILSVTDRVENPACFMDLKYAVDPGSVKLSDQEKSLLSNDFLNITNTLEIRKVDFVASDYSSKNNDINQNDLIGFIHSGCNIFPNILGKRFIYNIVDYVYENNLFSEEQIKQGNLGIPLNTELGTQFYQWLKAAMNYALVNRYLIFRAIQKFLQQQFGCEVSLINDVAHAGIFSSFQNQAEYTVSTRGVQLLSSPAESNLTHHLRLMAGQKESIALLVASGAKAEKYDSLMQHGTSYEIADSVVTHDYFSSETKEKYIHAANSAYYNTEYEIGNCIPYSFNALVTQDYLASIELIDPVAILMPVINIHGKALI